MGCISDHLEPPPIPLIKETTTCKSYGYYVKLNLSRYPMYSTSDPYEFRISFFDYGELEEFLLFIKIFLMNRGAMGTLETEAKVQYVCMLVRGEALSHFDLVSADAKII